MDEQEQAASIETPARPGGIGRVLRSTAGRIAIGLVVLAIAGGVAFALTRTPTHTIKGRLAAPECGGGYDIELSQVELRNEKNEIVGSAQTSANHLAEIPKVDCVVTFRIPEVPETRFYSIEVGTHEGPNYSLQQIRDNDWTMTLGIDDAITDYPTAEDGELCRMATTLNDAALDIDTYNDSRDEWVTEVEGAALVLLHVAAGLAIEGDDDKAADIATAVAPIADISEITDDVFLSGDRYFDRLNEAFDEADSVFATELDCLGWDEIDYSPA